MKAACFWNNLDHAELKLIINIFKDKEFLFHNNFEQTFLVFLYPKNKFDNSIKKEESLHLIGYETGKSQVSIFEALKTAFLYAKENGIKYGIFSNSPVLILDPHKLAGLLESKEVESNAFSLRVGNINGVAIKFSPRLPFVDENFIIFNTEKCDHLKIFSREHSFASHFEKWGSLHASLLSFLEACVPYGYVHVYSDGSDCRDLFGKSKKFLSTDYLYSHKFGFLSTTPNYDKSIHILKAELLKSLSFGSNSFVKEYIDKNQSSGKNFYYQEGVPYFKKNILGKIIDLLDVLRIKMVTKVNFEFIKRYKKG